MQVSGSLGSAGYPSWRGVVKLICFALALIAAFAIAGISDVGAQSVRKLRITLQLPITNHLGTNLVAFKEIVERETNNRFEIEIFDKAQLYRDNQVIEAVSGGKIEMGVVALNQYRDTVPAVDIFGQPFMFNLPALLDEATRPDQVIRQRLDPAILAATGTRPLWWQPYGSSVFFSRGRKGITRPQHVDDRKVRVLSEGDGDFIRMCGGLPSRIPGSKQHQALQEGAVEMGITGVVGVNSRKLYEVTDTITKTNHSAIEFVVIINETVWKSLKAEDQSIIQQAAHKVEKDLREKFAAVEKKAYAFAAEKQMTVVDVSPNDLIEWRACSAAMIDQFLRRSGDLGQKLMADYGRLRVDPCCSAGPPGRFTRH